MRWVEACKWLLLSTILTIFCSRISLTESLVYSACNELPKYCFMWNTLKRTLSRCWEYSCVYLEVEGCDGTRTRKEAGWISTWMGSIFYLSFSILYFCIFSILWLYFWALFSLWLLSKSEEQSMKEIAGTIVFKARLVADMGTASSHKILKFWHSSHCFSRNLRLAPLILQRKGVKNSLYFSLLLQWLFLGCSRTFLFRSLSSTLFAWYQTC